MDDAESQELIAELERLTKQAQAVAPDSDPPLSSVQRLRDCLEELIARCPEEMRSTALEPVREALSAGRLDADLLKGAWYLATYTLDQGVDLVRRHYSGEYQTDTWGLDREFVNAVRPFFAFLYKVYWRVETAGLENVPSEGRALLVANHSGQLPWDGTMLTLAVLSEHPAQRLARVLYSGMFPGVPFISSWLVRMGGTLAAVENCTRLLEQDELVVVFPEGYKGIGKTFRHRYVLARFGRGGFVRAALSSGAPIIPVAVVGAEETYISLHKSSTLAAITGMPYFPITPTFPWLGVLGFVPLPTKWTIDFGKPIPTAGYGPDAADNPALVLQLTDEVRGVVQDMLDDRLARRRSVFR
jgi:1-acyl-sn-glycerol-3-phosphate acyltransferase